MIFPYLMSNWSCIEYFKHFQNDEILGLGRTFLSGVSPVVEHLGKKAKSMPYILSFWSTFQLKNWWSYGNLKMWPIFGPDDVIDDVINTKKYTPIARSKIHICTKFGVDCLNGVTSIVNITDPQTNETAIGDCELAKILNDSLTVIFIDIYILFFVSISAIFSHFLLFSQ